MRGKNFLVFFVIVFLLFQISFSIAVSDSDTGVPGVSSEDLETLNKVTNLADSDNWESLTQSWKQKILGNEIVVELDSFLQQLDFVFVIIMQIL